MTNRTEML